MHFTAEYLYPIHNSMLKISKKERKDNKPSSAKIIVLNINKHF